METSLTPSELLRLSIRLVPWPWRTTIRRIPGVAQVSRFLVARVLAGQDFEHRVDAGPAKGIVFPVRMPEDKNIWTGTYEIGLADRVAAVVTPGCVAYDIGGWHGFFAGVMAAQDARTVHVFEPLPENGDRIRRLIALNPGRNIHLHPLAVGERDSTAELLVMPETSMAKLGASSFQNGQERRSSLSVAVRSLDAMVSDGTLQEPHVMKIDVEGAEVMVLRGALGVIRRSRPHLFIEVHSSPLREECRQLLEAEGYQVELLDRDTAGAARSDIQLLCARAGR